ncbi:unnamed protein product [Prunus armeniaca]
MRGVSLEALRHFQFLPFQKIPDLQRLLTPRSAWTRLATAPHAFPALNVQIAKQPDASGVFLPPRADAREGMPLKTLVKIRDGKVADTLEGADPSSLANKVAVKPQEPAPELTKENESSQG